MKHWTMKFVFAVALGCAAAPLACASGFTFQSFTIPNVASGNNALSVDGINDFGMLSGNLTDLSNNLKGWVRDPFGHVTLLVDPLDKVSPSVTTANQDNDLGVVVGEYYDSGANQFLGYFYFAGNFKSYGVPTMAAGGSTSLVGINNVGGFCGYTSNPPFTQWNAFVTIQGKTTVFSVNGATHSYCQAMNDEGFAIGLYVDAAGVQHGWVRNPHTGDIRTIDVPGASSVAGLIPCSTTVTGGTDVLGINDRGEISGHFYDSANLEHGFVELPDGEFKQIDVPGAFLTGGGGVNNFGQVAGHYVDNSCNSHGFIATPSDHDHD